VEFRFAQEQVNVLGHEDVAEEVEAVPLSQPFECFEEDASGEIVGEIRETPGATEGEEVVIALGVISLETARHEEGGTGNRVTHRGCAGSMWMPNPTHALRA